MGADFLVEHGVRPELVAILRDFHKRHPAYFHQKDEQDYPRDDSDIEAHSRVTRYPWGDGST